MVVHDGVVKSTFIGQVPERERVDWMLARVGGRYLV